MTTPIPTQVKNLLNLHRTSDALSLLLNASQSNKQLQGAIQAVLGEFNELTSQKVSGYIAETEANQKLNSIHDKILMALNFFDGEGKLLPGSAVIVSGQRNRLLLRVGLMVICGSFLLVPLGIALKLMSIEGASEVMIAGWFLGMAGLFVLVLWLLGRVKESGVI
ncbi:MAG: hypothetical protein R3A50_07795 [Saprospiraceae bacterium]|nr:hypothetical protein [Saprospiraceae bacterium]MCB9345319.1 hypothetical protein [Lewinellaceae bacterium]